MPSSRTSPTTGTASERRIRLGTCLGTTFEVAAQAPDEAPVDLSVACMFEREPTGASLGGGLLHLDQALGGALTSARGSGHFGAGLLDSLLVTHPPATVRAKAILVVGLGDPGALGEDTLARACAFAVAQAARLRAGTAAFAPNLLDAGVVVRRDLRVAHAMLRGALSALALSDHLGLRGLATPQQPLTWTFDAGASHFPAVVDDFRHAFDDLSKASSPLRPDR